MRTRFFGIILVVLLAVTACAAWLHSVFVESERLQLIDQQVRITAAALLDSDLPQVRIVNFRTIEAIISEELGENSIGKFFLIRNDEGKLIYESAGAKLLPVSNLPIEPQWITVHNKGRYIRILNLRLPSIHDRTLQVGVVVEDELISSSLWSEANLIFLLAMTTLGLIVAWVLTSTLLRPVQSLERFVSLVALEQASTGELPFVPDELKSRQRDDEFSKLITGLNALIARVNRGYRMSRIWAYQMAHEIKTPMAVLSIELEKAQSANQLAPELANFLSGEIRRIGETVSAFLNWAELENSGPNEHLHAIKLDKTLRAIAHRFETQFRGRIHIETNGEIYVVADPQKLEFMIQNLVQNALKYSPPTQPVRLSLVGCRLEVSDRGPGLPEEVRSRLGEPFNKGQQKPEHDRGHGLGLAWAISVAKHYQWKLEINSSAEGTIFTIHFPERADDMESEDQDSSGDTTPNEKSYSLLQV